MNIRLTNGKKTIIRTKDQYEANIKHFNLRGFKPEQDVVKEDKVVELKPKKRKTRKKKNESMDLETN